MPLHAANPAASQVRLPCASLHSNSGTAGPGGAINSKFDVFVAPRTVHDPGDIANPNSTYSAYFPVPFTPGCFPGNNLDCPTCNCSEPHEPYLNIKYSGNPMGAFEKNGFVEVSAFEPYPVLRLDLEGPR